MGIILIYVDSKILKIIINRLFIHSLPTSPTPRFIVSKSQSQWYRPGRKEKRKYISPLRSRASLLFRVFPGTTVKGLSCSLLTVSVFTGLETPPSISGLNQVWALGVPRLSPFQSSLLPPPPLTAGDCYPAPSHWRYAGLCCG